MSSGVIQLEADHGAVVEAALTASASDEAWGASVQTALAPILRGSFGCVLQIFEHAPDLSTIRFRAEVCPTELADFYRAGRRDDDRVYLP